LACSDTSLLLINWAFRADCRRPAYCGERRSRASHGRIVTEVRVRGEGAARERGHFSLLLDSRHMERAQRQHPVTRNATITTAKEPFALTLIPRVKSSPVSRHYSWCSRIEPSL